MSLPHPKERVFDSDPHRFFSGEQLEPHSYGTIGTIGTCSLVVKRLERSEAVERLELLLQTVARCLMPVAY
jgi:hypothetical protein